MCLRSNLYCQGVDGVDRDADLSVDASQTDPVQLARCDVNWLAVTIFGWMQLFVVVARRTGSVRRSVADKISFGLAVTNLWVVRFSQVVSAVCCVKLNLVLRRCLHTEPRAWTICIRSDSVCRSV